MFDRIVLRRPHDSSKSISAGQIAEALLYYQRVHIFIDQGMLFGLIRQLNPAGVLGLLSRGDITATYCDEILGVLTETRGILSTHRFSEITTSGDQSTGELKTPQERLEFSLSRELKDKSAAKSFTKKFFERVPARRYSGNHFLKGGVSSAAKSDALDPAFLTKAVRQSLRATPGGYDPGDGVKLEIVDSELGLYVFHDIDFERINSARSIIAPSQGPLTIAHLLSHIQEARADLALASFYGGDFVTTEISSSIIQTRHSDLLRRAGLNKEARDNFLEIVLPDTPSLAEVIDSGERSLEEFFKLLDQAQRFKRWLGSVSPDEGLVRTYMQDVSSEGWIQRLPAKSVRYIISTTIGTANPIAGLIAGLADSFLLEKLCKGWRPSHFINSKYSPFLR